MGRKPTLIAIDHDDDLASHIGRTADKRQFFLTTPFVPARGINGGREFVALYLFDLKGKLLEAKIDDLGSRAELNEKRIQKIRDKRLAELGKIDYRRIEVKPFKIEKFDTVFGLIPRAPEDEDDGWWVEAEPGNYMAFQEPWDSGEYDS
jgi:hypothetical protein